MCIRDSNEYDITRTQKVDGSTTVVVKQPLQTEWSNSVGADLAPSRPATYPLPLPTERNNGLPAGAAWASVGVPNLCLLYTSDAADERSSVDLGGRRII